MSPQGTQECRGLLDHATHLSSRSPQSLVKQARAVSHCWSSLLFLCWFLLVLNLQGALFFSDPYVLWGPQGRICTPSLMHLINQNILHCQPFLDSSQSFHRPSGGLRDYVGCPWLAENRLPTPSGSSSFRWLYWDIIHTRQFIPVYGVQFSGFECFHRVVITTSHVRTLKGEPIPLNHHFPNLPIPHPQLPATAHLLSVFMALPVMNISSRWNHTICGPGRLAPCTESDVFKGHAPRKQMSVLRSCCMAE